MASNVGKINVAIEADNKGLKSGLRQAESQVDRSSKQMQASMEKNISFGAAFTKMLALGGAIEGALKGAKAISKAFKGDLDGVNEALASMPMGIGQVAAAVQDLALEWYGVADAQAAAAKASSQHKQNIRTQRGASSLMRGLKQQVKLGGITDPKERAIEVAAIKMENTIAKITALAGGKFKRGEGPDEIRALAKTIFDQQVKAIKMGKAGKASAGAEGGFEEVGLTRSRLSGRGGALEIVKDKAPTRRGQMDMVTALKELVRLGQARVAVAVAG